MPGLWLALTDACFNLLDRLHLNFFRIHVIWFFVNPLIWSVIFWGCNGQYPVKYIDALYLCVSAHTVTGLGSVNLSTLTGFQQFILFYLMCIGNYTIVSWVMVLVRKHYFVVRVIEERPQPRLPERLANLGTRVRSYTMAAFDTVTHSRQPLSDVGKPLASPSQGLMPMTEKPTSTGLSNSDTLQPINQSSDPLKSGQMLLGTSTPGVRSSGATPAALPTPPVHDEPAKAEETSLRGSPSKSPFREVFDADNLYRTESPSAMSHALSNPSVPPTSAGPGQVNFAIPEVRPTRSRVPMIARPSMTRQQTLTITPVPGPERRGTGLFFSQSNSLRESEVQRPGFDRHPTPWPVSEAKTEPLIDTHPSRAPTYEQGFGGFPSPITLAGRFIHWIAPNHVHELRRKLTLDEGKIYAPKTFSLNPETASQSANGQHASGISRVRTEQSGRLRQRHQQDATLVQPDMNEDDTSVPEAPRTPLAPPYMDSTHVATNVPEHLRHRIPRSSLHDHRNSLHHSRGPGSNRSGPSSTGWMTDLQSDIVKTVNYFKTGVLKVGRNSAFNTDELSQEQLEELGGIEYRALGTLSWVVGLYYIGTQFATFIIFIGVLYNTNKYDSVFESQPRLIPKAWFSAFQAVSSYTGGGLSLCDQGMIPFIDAHTLVFFQAWLIAAGSMLLPCFLRLIVWILWKFSSGKDREPLQFLLDHPRRCFIYLFPSHQTWFLVVVFFVLTFIEWFGFLILNIGLEVINVIPLNTRVLAALFQSVAVRSSGYAIFNLGAIAPSVRFLYLIMMYISAYPIAMSIRSTNVYEQRSLGIYEDVDTSEVNPDVDEKAAKLVKNPKGEVLFSKYLGMHVRRQLAYDLWWLALGVFIINIAERGNLMNPDNGLWFNQFQIMFEVVSAYGTIGLSLGIPTENYSFSGAFSPISKLVVMAVMLRGRHRDLPQAIDRAILLPHEFSRIKVNPAGYHIMEVPDQINDDIDPKPATVVNPVTGEKDPVLDAVVVPIRET